MTSYNDNAIALAERIQNHRREQVRAREHPSSPNLADMLPSFDPTALGAHLEYERMGNRPVSDELAARAAEIGAEFEHLGMTLGTVIHGVDLRNDLSPGLTSFVRDTLLERKVVFFREQHLSEAEHVTFASQFGSLDAFPFAKPGEDPLITSIEHGPHSPGLENGWHTDVTWMERPSLGSIAQMVEAPPYGGDTLFSDSHAAYLGLPADLREQIDHLDGVNDYRDFLRGRGAGRLPDDLVADVKEAIPFGVTHPLVRTHPETGKRALYLHGGFLRHDSLTDRRTGEPVDPAESKAVVGRLLAQHARPEYQCRFIWQNGSIAFWDNRAVQHYAASDYYPHRRVLRRITVSGDRPVH